MSFGGRSKSPKLSPEEPKVITRTRAEAVEKEKEREKRRNLLKLKKNRTIMTDPSLVANRPVTKARTLGGA